MRRWFAGGDRTLWSVVGAVAAGSAVLLGALAARGSWYADDLDFLIHGDRGFGASDLVAPVNDHFTPGLRVAYAVFAAAAPLDYGVTVAARVLLWVVAVLLMSALVHRAFGQSRATVVATTTYALSPLVMPSFMSLSSAMDNLPAQVLGLFSLHLALDWFERRRRTALAGGVLALAASVAFWEKSALIVVTGVALGLILRGRPARRGGLGVWVVVQLASLGALTVLLLSLHGPLGGRIPPWGVLTRLWLSSLERAVLPALVGGPWSWQPGTPPYFGLAVPRPAVVVLGTAVLLTGLVVCVRRARPVLWAWAAVAVYAAATVAVVAFGRYDATGETLTMHYHYWSDAAVPTAIAVAGTTAALPRLVGAGRVAAVTGVAVWVVITVGSWAGFAQLWGRNPSGTYVSRLASALQDRQGVNLWDTPPPPDVMPVLSNNRQVSGIVRLLGVDATFQDPGSEPEMVARDGTIVAARFVTWVSVPVPRDCGLTLRRTESVTLPLPGGLPEGRWYARVGYLANPEVAVDVRLQTDAGTSVALVGSGRPWPAGLATANLASTAEAPGSAIVLSTSGENANLCLGSVSIGVVEPAP